MEVRILPTVSNPVLAYATRFFTTKSTFGRVLELAIRCHDITNRNPVSKLAHFTVLLLVTHKQNFYITVKETCIYDFMTLP